MDRSIDRYLIKHLLEELIVIYLEENMRPNLNKILLVVCTDRPCHINMGAAA
jgi:hypothetical protein